MPARRKYARKPRAKRPYKKRVYRRNARVMINTMPRRVHNIVAPIFFTTMQLQAQARLEIGSGPAGRFSINCSKLLNPFATDDPLTTIATQLGAIDIDTISPTGLQALAALYDSYKVHKCTMRITFTPATTVDPLLLIALPQDGEMAFTSTAQTAQAQVYAKTITCTGTNNIKQNTLHMGIKQRTYFGKTKQAYRAENDYAGMDGILSTIPNIEMYYFIYYSLYSGVVSVGPISINIVLTYNVEFFQPTNNVAIV